MDTPSDWIIEGEVDNMIVLLKNHPSWRMQWIPREASQMAHNIAKWGRDIDCRKNNNNNKRCCK